MLLFRQSSVRAFAAAAKATAPKRAATASKPPAAPAPAVEASAEQPKKRKSKAADTPVILEAEPKPPRPLSGYNLYTSEYMKQHKGTKMAQVAVQWKELSLNEKEVYSQRAAKLPPREPKLPEVRGPRQKSAWDYFLADFRQSKEAASLAPKDTMIKAGEKFQKLTDADKQKLKQQHQQ